MGRARSVRRLRGAWRKQGGKKTFDAAGFARLERKTEPAATASSVREAIENWLDAAPVYRVRWDTKGVRESAAELGDWDDPALNN